MSRRKRTRARKTRASRRPKPMKRRRHAARKARTSRRRARAVRPVRRTIRRKRPARRAQARPRPPVRRVAGTGDRLSSDHAAFWTTGELAGFTVDIAPSAVPGGTLKRLGPPPLGAESGIVERTLRRTYAAAASLALSLARR